MEGAWDPIAYCRNLYTTAFEARLFPDCALRAFGTSYPVHCIILASQSTYFATLLRWVSLKPVAAGSKGREEEWSELPSHELVLGEDVTKRGFEWLLEYFYASPHLSITRDNVFDILATAHYLGVTAVQTACVQFLSQHLDPHNLTACLLWATRTDHGEASDMLAAACRRVLALRLPSSLAEWLPALPHLEPRTLLEILASDHLAVETEYDRYDLVKQVVAVLAAQAAAPLPAVVPVPASCRGTRGGPGGKPLGGDGRASGGMGTASTAEAKPDAAGGRELQRMLSAALHVESEGLGRQLRLRLSRSCPAELVRPLACPVAKPSSPGVTARGSNRGSGAESGPVGFQNVTDTTAAGGDGCCGGPDCGTAGGRGALLPPPSDCADDSSVCAAALSSDASSRSTVRCSDAAIGVAAMGASDRDGECDTDSGGDRCSRDGQLTDAPPPSLVGQGTRPGTSGAAAPNIGGERLGDRDESEAVGQYRKGPATGATAAVVAAEARVEAEAADVAATARLLLHEAVRYEHLSVPQLMAVQREGLAEASVLQAALWERTRLDWELAACDPTSSTSRPRAAAVAVSGQDSGQGHSNASQGALGVVMQLGQTTNPLGLQPQPPPLSETRPYRVCWRLRCEALRTLRANGILQSQPYSYAGSFWRLRLCRSGAAGAPAASAAGGHLGLFVGRHLPSAAECLGVQGAQGLAALSGAPVPAVLQDAAADRHARPHPGQQLHPHQARHYGPGHRWQRPDRHRIDPGRHLGALAHPARGASPSAAAAGTAVAGFGVGPQPGLRGRCRLSAFQPDNTVLQGRLCLGDSGEFAVEFAAGGYFGSGRLVSEDDLAGLPDDAEVLLFVQILAIVG